MLSKSTTVLCRFSVMKLCVRLRGEFTDAVRKNVAIDWMLRENVRAQLRVIIKQILRKYGYPPDKQELATQTVLEQVELLGWEVTG